jgi:hypothetical protein
MEFQGRRSYWSERLFTSLPRLTRSLSRDAWASTAGILAVGAIAAASCMPNLGKQLDPRGPATGAELDPATNECFSSFQVNAGNVLQQACNLCHMPGGMAAGSLFILPSDATSSEAYSSYINNNLIDRDNPSPDQSRLLLVGSAAASHTGGNAFSIYGGPGSYEAVRLWVEREIQGSCDITE